MEISITTNTQTKIFHIETFKEDSWREEGTDWDLGGDFDWQREICWQVWGTMWYTVGRGQV